MLMCGYQDLLFAFEWYVCSNSALKYSVGTAVGPKYLLYKTIYIATLARWDTRHHVQVHAYCKACFCATAHMGASQNAPRTIPKSDPFSIIHVYIEICMYIYIYTHIYIYMPLSLSLSNVTSLINPRLRKSGGILGFDLGTSSYLIRNLYAPFCDLPKQKTYRV